MADDLHIYCLLARVRHYPGRSSVMELRYAWVPEKWAEVGHTIELRCPAGLWLCGWEVRALYQSSIPQLPVLKSRAG